MRIPPFLIAAVVVFQVRAQAVLDPTTLDCGTTGGGVHVTPLHSDSTSSSFLICIDKEVRPHLHRVHTEHVFVIDGEAMMLLGDVERAIGPGSTIVIPAGTAHAVRVTSAPLRVISVQSPYFDGTDRIMLPE